MLNSVLPGWRRGQKESEQQLVMQEFPKICSQVCTGLDNSFFFSLWLEVLQLAEKVKQCLHEACKVLSDAGSISVGLATAAGALWWQSCSSEDDLPQACSAERESSRGNGLLPCVYSICRTQNFTCVCCFCKEQGSVLCTRAQETVWAHGDFWI